MKKKKKKKKKTKKMKKIVLLIWMLVRSHIVVQGVGWFRRDDNEQLDEEQRG